MNEDGRKYEFIWKIENFNSNLPKIGNVVIDNKCLESPHFNFYLFGNTEWYLELYPKSGRGGAFLKCLPICKDYARDSPVTIEISVLTSNGLVHSSKKVKGRCSGVFHCDFANAIEIERSTLPLQNDLILRCILLNEENEGDYDDIVNDHEDLSRDLLHFYRNQLLTDLTLCVGREKLPVHRALLCIRASKFAEKLKIQDGENYKSVINVQNISLPVLKILLTYLYTGQINDPFDDKLLELSKIAKEYNLVHLQSELLPVAVYSTACTKVESFKEVFNWQIDDFCLAKTTVLKIIDLELGRFLITLTRLPSNHSRISFKIVSFPESKIVYLRCKLCVIDRAGELTLFSDHEHCFESDEITKEKGVISKENWIFPTLLNNGDLTSNREKYLPHNKLNLKLELETTEGKKVNETIETRKLLKGQSSKISHLNSLSNDFLDIFKVKNRPCVNGDYYDGDCYNDLTLKVGKNEIKCHKFIIGARSPVFANMLHYNTQIKEIKVDVTDTDYDTLLLLVQYIYSGNVSNVAAMEIAKLYLAAEKYQIESLSKKCISLLEKTLSIHNICDVLIFADDHFNTLLMESTYKYIQSNKKDVLESEEWKNLIRKNPSLTTKISTKISNEERRPREFYRGFPRSRGFRVRPRGYYRGGYK